MLCVNGLVLFYVFFFPLFVLAGFSLISYVLIVSGVENDLIIYVFKIGCEETKALPISAQN